MKPTTKAHWDDLGGIIGRWMPKAVCFGYYVFFAWAWHYVVTWFMNYDFSAVTEPTVALAIAGFPTAILAVLTRLLQTLTETAFKAMNGGLRNVPDNK